MAPSIEEINARIRNAWPQLPLITENRRRDNVPERLDSLRSHHNRNGNLAGNLYDATSLVKIKREFLFTPGKEPLNHLP